ncbi:MAG: hypothetical protein R2747_05400 [Pyrinomonadaceae bacterium]
MKIHLFFLFLAFSILSMSNSLCALNPLQNTLLPAEMPDNTTMSWSENGGMAPTFKRIEIRGEQLVVTQRTFQDREPKSWYAKISLDDKKIAYRVFYDNKFDLIVNDKREGTVYDAGSEGVSIRAERVSKHISSGPNSPLSGRNLSRYEAAAAAVKALAEKYKTDLKPVKENFAIIDYNPAKHSFIIPEGKRTELNYLEIEQVETLFKQAVEENNKTAREGQKIENLDKYRLQFIPFLNQQNEKVIWINGFCSNQPGWEKELVLVKDGGNCYFNLYVNLTQNSFEKFQVNGEG